MIMKPIPLSERQRTSKGIDWILKASDGRSGRERGVRIAKEMIAIVTGESPVLKTKQTAHIAGMLARCVKQVLLMRAFSDQQTLKFQRSPQAVEASSPGSKSIHFGTYTTIILSIQ